MEEIEECHGCGFETDELHRYSAHVGQGETKIFEFCDICYTSFSGNAAIYPTQYEGVGKVLQHVSYCTNLILAAIKELKEK